MASFKVFTIESGSVSEGALVGKLTIKSGNIEIPAVIVGQEGRGRERGVLPVLLTSGQYKEWQEKGEVRILYADVSTTKAGKPKLFAKESATGEEKVICVFNTKIGYRGGNSHTGDKYFVPCPNRGKKISGHYDCPECEIEMLSRDAGSEAFWAGVVHSEDKGEKASWHPFPGETLVKGMIAQGTAGAMGSGDQLVATMPKDVVFRTGYSGRLYGGPSAHYYVWNGSQLLSATWDERAATDLF